MKKYGIVTKARKMEDDFYFPLLTSTITVYEEFMEPTATGLLDKDGREIVSFYSKEPIGFIHHPEE